MIKERSKRTLVVINIGMRSSWRFKTYVGFAGHMSFLKFKPVWLYLFPNSAIFMALTRLAELVHCIESYYIIILGGNGMGWRVSSELLDAERL